MMDYEIKDGVAIIPEGTTKIEADAFRGCKELTSIVILNSCLLTPQLLLFNSLFFNFSISLPPHEIIFR